VAYMQPYQAPGVQPVAQPVMVAYQGPSPVGVGPACTICRLPCVGTHFKCITCGKNRKDYFLCASCHSRLPKKSGGLFNINGIVNGLNRDIATVARVLDTDIPHESWHDFQRVEQPVYVQPAMQYVMAPAQGYNPNLAMGPQYGGQYAAPPPGAYQQPMGGQMGAPPSYNPSAPAETSSPQSGYSAPQQGYAPQGYEAQPQGYQQQQVYSPPAAAQQVYFPPGPSAPPPMAQTVVSAAQPANRVQLIISCRQLPAAQITGEKPTPSVLVMSGNRELGRTEPVYGNSDPMFKTAITISKDESKLTFIVYDAGDKRLGAVKDVPLRDIMSSPEWTARLNDVKTGYRLNSGSVVVNWAAVV